MTAMRAWIEGRAATPDELQALALGNDGHFTTMQVRAGAVQGFDLHLRRLCDATLELYGCDLDQDRVRTDVRRALLAENVGDCTSRVTVFRRDRDAGQPDDGIVVLVAVGPPRQPGAMPSRVMSFRRTRVLPHLKHVGIFMQQHGRRLAQLEGFDDALLVGDDDVVAEGTFWNVGFWDGDAVTWPQAPALRGVTERLLQAGLAEAGIAQRTKMVHASALAGFRAAFAANTRGVHGIAAVDATSFAGDARLQDLLSGLLARCPWQAI